MKIDFNSVYKDIAKLLDSPASGAASTPGDRSSFAKLLSEISPDARKQAVIEAKTEIPAEPLPEPEPEPMASFNFSRPELAGISYEPIKPEIPEKEPDGIPPESVKSPTVLEARRVEIPAGLSKMRHSERVSEVKKYVQAAGEQHGVDPLLGMAVVSRESAFDPNAISRDGHYSKGLFQLLDSTGKGLFERAGKSGAYDPFDPRLNVELGVGYLRYLHDIFSRGTELPNNLRTVGAANSTSLEKLAVAAFNAGEGRVAWAQSRAEKAGRDPSRYEDVAPYLPESTQEYVQKVLRSKADFERSFIG